MVVAMKRTDVHRPSVINVDDYTFITVVDMRDSGGDLGQAIMNQQNREHLREFMQSNGASYSHHSHGGSCHVCGAVALCLAYFWHRPSNTVVCTGEDCADKIELGLGSQFRKIRDEATALREAKAGKLKAKAILDDAGLSRAWELYLLRNTSDKSSLDALVSLGAVTVLQAGTQYENWHMTFAYNTLANIVDKLVKYGNVSEKQITFLHNLVHEVDNKAKVDAERQAAHDALPDCPSGKLEIEGEVVSLKIQGGMYGTEYKMVVKADAGWKVWVSVPSSLHGMKLEQEQYRTRCLVRGDRVKFSATVTPSDKDSKFGFGKRPTKAVCLTLMDAEMLERSRNAEKWGYRSDRDGDDF